MRKTMKTKCVTRANREHNNIKLNRQKASNEKHKQNTHNTKHTHLDKGVSAHTNTNKQTHVVVFF